MYQYWNYQCTDDFRQAIGQLTSGPNLANNLRQCQVLVNKAVKAGARVRLPVMFHIVYITNGS